jgi:hypothetical protein
MRRLLVLGTALLAVGALLGVALAAGPSPGVLNGDLGVAAPDGKTRYVATKKGATTLVSAIDAATNKTLRSTTLPGIYGVPMITFSSGDTGGLTPDGRTLVLGSSPYTDTGLAKTSRFAVLDTRTLNVRTTFSLPGLFSFDALSPNGKTLYLIQYVLETQQYRYHVRAYDLAAHRLVRQVVADKREGTKSMVGNALSRATGPGGRWVYTLYSTTGQPFIHALNAAQRFAVCVDLTWKGSPEELGATELALNADASRLYVRPKAGGRPVIVVDTKTLQVIG